jgi:hypothetical protein
MFKRAYPNLKTGVLIDETRFHINRSNKNNEIYVIPMHRKIVWD